MWRTMYESNVLGTMRMTRALLPRLIESGDGHVVAVTSIAAFETYRGGAGYTAAKHAQRAMLRTLRLELLGEPVSVTEIAPGMVETEFSAGPLRRRRGGGGEGLRRDGAAAAPRTSPSASAGRSPSPPTSTSTRSSSARATRRRATEVHRRRAESGPRRLGLPSSARYPNAAGRKPATPER